MREIKFRGMQRFGENEGKWAFGSLLILGLRHYIVPIPPKHETPADDVTLLAQVCERVDVFAESVGQSIIVDGKEFYVGDVIKDDTDDIGVVRFGELPLGKSGDCVCTYPAFYIQCFGQLGQAPTFDCQQIGEWMEVIGTIHTTHLNLLEQDNGR